MSEISIKKAAMINFVAKYINIFLQVLFSAILSRILTPEDFGIVAVVTVFTTFFMVFADMGFGTAVIQKKTLTDEDINNIFSFTFYMAILLAILFAFFGIILSIFYENEVYKPIGIILSISLFFSTMNMIPNAILYKSKEFKKLGLRSIVIALISSVLTIALALLGFKYYAIVLNSVISALLAFIWNYKSVQLKLRFKFDISSVIKIKEFSSFQFAFNLVNYFSRNLDNLLISKIMGVVALAYYDKAYKLMLYPVGNLTQVITPVLHPILSEHQDDKHYIFTQYMKVVKILSLMGVFLSTYCLFAAEEIILIMFGDQWIKAVPCFRLLALSVWPQMVTASTGSIFQSLGNTRLLFLTGNINSVITIIAIIIGVSYKNLIIVAACVAIAYNLHFCIAFYILMKYGFENRHRDFFVRMIPDLVLFLITIIGFYLASFIEVNNIILSALYKGFVGGGAYIVGLLLTKQYQVVLQLFKKDNNPVQNEPSKGGS